MNKEKLTEEVNWELSFDLKMNKLDDIYRRNRSLAYKVVKIHKNII